jgi:hypothetical protein
MITEQSLWELAFRCVMNAAGFTLAMGLVVGALGLLHGRD